MVNVPRFLSVSTDEAVFVGVEGLKTPAPPLAANTAHITGAFGCAVCSLCQYNQRHRGDF